MTTYEYEAPKATRWHRVCVELENFYEIYNSGEFLSENGLINDEALEAIEVLMEAYDEFLE